MKKPKPKAKKEKPERTKDLAAVLLAAKRMEKLSPARRRQIARQAARARWGPKKGA